MGNCSSRRNVTVFEIGEYLCLDDFLGFSWFIHSKGDFFLFFFLPTVSWTKRTVASRPGGDTTSYWQLIQLFQLFQLFVSHINGNEMAIAVLLRSTSKFRAERKELFHLLWRH